MALLGDMPGWFSGFQEHDEAADEALRRQADLVAFVMTVDLGGAPLVDAMAYVLDELGFGSRGLVIVNKANTEDSDRTLLVDEVTSRLGPDRGTPIIFTDVQDALDAVDSRPDLSDRGREILRRTSGIVELEQTLEDTINRHASSARTSAHLHQAMRVLGAAREYWAPDQEEDALRAMVADIGGRARATRTRLAATFEAEVGRLHKEISALGDELISASEARFTGCGS